MIEPLIRSLPDGRLELHRYLFNWRLKLIKDSPLDSLGLIVDEW